MIAALRHQARTVPSALQLAIRSRRAVLGTAALFLMALTFYAMLLPATNTGGAVGLVSLRFLTPGEFALAAIMAALLALTAALGVHSLRHGGRARPGRSILGAAMATFPALLCCTSVLPLAVTAVASVLPAVGAFGVPVQGFIATHESEIYGAAVALMAWGLYDSARRTLSCAR